MRDASYANKTLLGKLIWDLVQGSRKLWVQVLSSRYLCDTSVLEAVAKPNSSSLWRGILNPRYELRGGFSFNLGNSSTLVWFEDWSGHGLLGKHLPFVHISDSSLTLKDLIKEGHWNIAGLSTPLPEPVRQRLLDIAPVTKADLQEHWIWKPSSIGVYSAFDAYAWLCRSQTQILPSDSWQWIWKLEAPKKVCVFIWLLCHNVIQVNDHRYRCHLATSPACQRCDHPLEDNLHCLRDCM